MFWFDLGFYEQDPYKTHFCLMWCQVLQMCQRIPSYG